MRGKVLKKDGREREIRITPAYAGKSLSMWKEKVKIRDHPRLCGEKALNGALDVINKGSPPPMRGKGRLHLVRRKLFRITPAYAGKSE